MHQLAEHSRGRPLRLMLIGTLAGLFSGLFGVGGGSVIVPLLVLWLGYEEHAATATSLAAIVFIAAFAAG
ncbi:MAG TPA: sulfite exporter TauE/SafE family protein, partial [Solirubrobacteraceae bacterium]